ncbi:uncharacterized protein rbbp8l isoform X2 [Denticeps clupeoides]|uniref:DNA endonuclease Ctp1 N-terminal domain-containing protein n=1 Tax=Denticeps clupeoides TaxID=299321 RepID=A0AAY4E2Q0_9TELE|nr:RBBP8 N-terminal-like protein isoform X2 [Denticeps clupeoides]
MKSSHLKLYGGHSLTGLVCAGWGVPVLACRSIIAWATFDSASMAMNSFGELLQRLKELHEQEVEGWHEKVMEMTNKKCSDTKRMEELFTRNQQLREQQKNLTENIKQLENRLRAGLCDRCIVTQDVAKRRQQEYETSQLQSLQHISILASELNLLRKENKRLQEEVKGLQASLKTQKGVLAEAGTPQIKHPPDGSDPVTTLSLKTASPPPGGLVGKTELGRVCTVEEVLSELKPFLELSEQERESCRTHASSHAGPFSLPAAWKLERYSCKSAQSTEKRMLLQNVDSAEPRSPASPSIPSPLRLQMHNSTSYFSSSSTSSGTVDEKPSRIPVHNPIPFRPHPIKSVGLAMPWSTVLDNSDWGSLLVNASKNSLLCLPSLVQGPSLPRVLRVPSSEESPWLGQSPPPVQACLPRKVQRSLTDQDENINFWHKREGAVSVSPNLREPAVKTEKDIQNDTDAPLDLSDSGRSKSVTVSMKQTQSPTCGDSESSILSGQKLFWSSSSYSPHPPSASSVESFSSHLTDQRIEEQNSKGEQRKEESIPEAKEKKDVLACSLHPVVVLDVLKNEMSAHDSARKEQTTDEGAESVQERGEQDKEQEEEEDNQISRRRRQLQETDSIHWRSQKRKRMRMSVPLQGKSPGDTEQG